MSTTEAIKIKPLAKKKPALPYKFEDRLKLPPEVRVTVSFEEFIELAVECEYKVEYHNGQAVSIFDYDAKTKTMSSATFTHELLVINIGSLFNILFKSNIDVKVIGSNMKIFIEKGRGTYQADLTLVKEEENIIPFRLWTPPQL